MMLKSEIVVSRINAWLEFEAFAQDDSSATDDIGIDFQTSPLLVIIKLSTVKLIWNPRFEMSAPEYHSG